MFSLVKVCDSGRKEYPQLRYYGIVLAEGESVADIEKAYAALSAHEREHGFYRMQQRVNGN